MCDRSGQEIPEPKTHERRLWLGDSQKSAPSTGNDSIDYGAERRSTFRDKLQQKEKRLLGRLEGVRALQKSLPLQLPLEADLAMQEMIKTL